MKLCRQEHFINVQELLYCVIYIFEEYTCICYKYDIFVDYRIFMINRSFSTNYIQPLAVGSRCIRDTALHIRGNYLEVGTSIRFGRRTC